MKKTAFEQKWEGVPANLFPQAIKIYRRRTLTIEEKVIELRMLSNLFFHDQMIVQILGISNSFVSQILRKHYYKK